ncbi:ankyrin-2b isoform X2 [Hemibagrus wyckioides]|uniref:ankyrin-2b isoform X2 n=1 Tax=Hemibagrus wyckioides TaxID=337641 RepID=UPI00266C8A58|nr:ankyrin-2b isoform X2 [Hemibagrus wyckioides]
MTDFEETLLESEHSEADFSEIAVELKQAPEDFTSYYASSTSLPFFQPSDKTVSDSVTLAQASSVTENPHCETEIPIPEAEAKSVCELPSNQRPSDEYMRHHVEEISAKFYRALFGEEYVEAKTFGKDINIVTESFKLSEHKGFSVNKVDATDALNVDQVTFELSSEVNRKSVMQSLETTSTNISNKEQLQNVKTVCSLPPKQLLSWHEGEIVASNIDSTLTQMSLDSATGQTNSLSNPILDESESLKFTTEFEVNIPESKFSETNSPYESNVPSIPDHRPFMQAELISPAEHRSSSPVSVSEYDTDLELFMHEYRSLSPESTVSLPPDSPLPSEYRSGSLDSCVLNDELRVYSRESVASSTEQKLLFPDSPIPDFRPHSPLPPECEYTAPKFNMHMDIPRISNQLCSFDMPESNTQFSPQRSFLMVSNEIDRPVSPGSWIECRSRTPESNGSFSPGSFTIDSLDRELSPEIPQDSEQCPWISDTFVDRSSGPGSIASLNEYRPLSCDSPIPSFTPEVYDYFIQVKGSRSSSPQSEISDLGYELSESLFEDRPSSPESSASVNECKCLSPDSPLPSFVQNVYEFTPIKECRFSENEYELISPIAFSEECRPLSPESLSSVSEHMPLSPDSPIPSFSLPICTLDTSLGYHSESVESDLSDSERNFISPTVLFENRPSSPDSVSSLNIPRPLSPGLILPNIPMYEAEPKLLQSQQQSSEILENDNCLNNNNNVLEGLLVPDSTELVSSQTAYTECEKELTSSEFTSENITKPQSLQLSAKVTAKKCRKVKKLSKKATPEKGNAQLPEQVESTLTYNLCSPSDCKSGTLLTEADIQTLTTDLCNSGSNQQAETFGLSEASTSVTGHIPNPLYNETMLTKGNEVAATKRKPHNLISKVHDPQYKGKTFCPNTIGFEYSVKTDENIPLSPDSPKQQLRPFYPESSLSVSGYRSPKPTCSNSKENESFVEGLFDVEQKPEFEARPLSPDSIPEYRPMSPESVILASDNRASSPDSFGAVGPLSSDSPIPQYSGLFCELMPVIDYRLSSPLSMASDKNYDEDDEYELNVVTQTVSRASSPDSMKSIDENRPLSSDSPTQQFGPFIPEGSLPVSGYRSCSPESVCSNSIENEAFADRLFVTEQRPESPDSFQSDFEGRPLSPDSIPEYRPMSPEFMILASDFRASSPDSCSAFRPLSPDSPIPQYSSVYFELVPVTRCRSSSLESLASDTDYDINILSDISSDWRTSPQSVASLVVNDCLPTDSPIPDFTSLFSEQAFPAFGYRSCSPESACSNSLEHESFSGDLFIVELRPESPDSVQSEFDHRPLSPDSIPEYRPMSPESLNLASDIRGSSPDSFSAFRPLSTDSPIPQYSASFCELVPMTGCRSSSLESLASDSDCEVIILSSINSDCRTSPEYSASLVDGEHLPPDSPVPDFRSLFPEHTVSVLGYRSCSPDSIYSNSLEDESFPENLFTAEQRPESPDSFQSEFEARPLSPDSIPEYRPMSPESLITASDIRASSPDSFSACRPLSPDSPIPQYSGLFCELMPVIDFRLSSPLSMASDKNYDEDDEYELNVVTQTLSRVSSPDSMKSIDENRPLSPDSPIQQFGPFFPEDSLLVSGYRSCSPESVCSNSIENEAFADSLSVTEQRPESPDSIQSESEARPLSPDSIPEYRPMSPESMMLASDFRGASPDSISACRPLSPDSPIPQYSAVLVDLPLVTGYRSCSPESTDSDKDYEVNILSIADSDLRPASPDSMGSIDENTRLSPDSPIRAFRPHFFENTVPGHGYRSCSPESICSNSIEYDVKPEYVVSLLDMRRASPDSVSSSRPLSPDSPIPQFSTMLDELQRVTGHRSPSPDSMVSDEDYEFNVYSAADSDHRTSSPASIASVNENTRLSPDSPIQAFAPSFSECALPISGYRSCSPESIDSNSVQCELFLGVDQRLVSPDSFVDKPVTSDSLLTYRAMSPESEILQFDIRGSSPDSICACRPLFPDSPIPQYSALFCEIVPVAGYRSSSLESLASGSDCELNILNFMTPDGRTSPESLTSLVSNEHLPPDSPVTDFGFPDCTLTGFGYRSCSPDSIYTNSLENESFPGDLFTVEQRPESPDSFQSEFEARPLSPDSIPEYRPMSPESMLTASDIRASSPDSFSACRPLSTDSPIPQYSGLFCELMPVIAHRLSSPLSMASDKNDEDDDYELNVVTQMLSRTSSPNSMKSIDENRPLSPDSPIQQFGPFFPEGSLPVSGYRSCSPKSMCSNSIENEAFADGLFVTEQRPESPDSFQSEFESRPLSPDSIPEYRPMSPDSMNLASDIRGASPDSCRPLCLDSPVPQYSTMFADLVLVTGHRSSSPESMASEKDYEVNVLSTADSDYGPSSPDSMASIDKDARLSPDSPIQAFTPSFLESTLPVFGYRSCSPESICSNSIDYELFNMSTQSIFSASEIRGSSPDSINVHRPLSPDSPIPQYSEMLVDLVSVTGHRSTSPEFVASDEDYEFNVFTSVPFDYRPASPESVLSADENKLILPDSATSHPQFQETIKMVPEYKLVYKTIPCNLISHVNDPHYKGEMFSSKTGVFEYTGCRMEIVQTCKMDESNGITDESGYKIPALTHETSQISMQSQKILTIPVSENQTAFSALSLKQSKKYNREPFEFPEEIPADSIICYTPEIHRCLVISDDLRASSPESIRSVNEFRPLSPDSPIPEHMPLLPSTTIFQYESRPPSPESVSSVNEFQRLSPDSPVPEFSAQSPVPCEHNVQLSVTNLIHISQIISDIFSSENALVCLEMEQRPVSPGYDLSECSSRSLSPPTFSFESICRCPSPEALREIEPTVSITPDSLIFDIDCRPESPESITSQTQCNDSMPDNQSHWASDVALLPVMTDEKSEIEILISESDLATSAQSQWSFNYVQNNGRRTLPWHEFVSEPEQEEKIGEHRESLPPVMNKVMKMSADDGDGRSILRIQEDHQRIKVVKQDLELQHKQGLEERSDSTTSEIGQQEFKTRALQDKGSEKYIQLKNQNREIKNKNISVSEDDSSQVQNQSTSVTILEQKAIESFVTGEGSIQTGVNDPKSLHYTSEQRTAVSTDPDNVCPAISLEQSLEQPKETSGLCEIHTTPFQFNHQQSHRTVIPNLSISSSPSSDYRDVTPHSVRIPFVGSRVLPTDLGPVTPMFSELCSNQKLSTNSQLSIENQHSETFHHVVSEVEKPVSALNTDDSDLVAGGICPVEIALAPTSFELSQSTGVKLMDVDLKKVKPRPVQSDSVESDIEFFDCQQTFSDVSEPELRSEDIFDAETYYHVEESSSLTNTPAYDYLSVTPKITERSEADSQDSPRPVSWGSEEIDLPIILEPEDECLDENDEEIIYPYGYADEHSYAEELPPRQGGQYDEDDDSLGREIAAELGLLSDSSEEEVLTTRVVRRRVIIQGDELPEISPYTVTEEQYTDEHGNIVTKKITRKIIRKYVSADGVEREEVIEEGAQQEAITVDDADGFSKVLKRTVVRSAGDQTEVTFSETAPVGKATASGFEGENAEGRKVSKVIKTMMVQGERMEKQIGDPSLSADLPSAKEDFEKDPDA